MEEGKMIENLLNIRYYIEYYCVYEICIIIFVYR